MVQPESFKVATLVSGNIPRRPLKKWKFHQMSKKSKRQVVKMETLSVNSLASRFLIFLEKTWKLDIHDAEPIVGHFYASSFF